jgi:hypothetical protein
MPATVDPNPWTPLRPGPCRPTGGAAPRAPRSPDSTAEGHRRSRLPAPGGSVERHAFPKAATMAHLLPDPIAEVVDFLVDRHDIAPGVAAGVLHRAARRKGISLDALASRIMGGPAPTVAG